MKTVDSRSVESDTGLTKIFNKAMYSDGMGRKASGAELEQRAKFVKLIHVHLPASTYNLLFVLHDNVLDTDRNPTPLLCYSTFSEHPDLLRAWLEKTFPNVWCCWRGSWHRIGYSKLPVDDPSSFEKFTMRFLPAVLGLCIFLIVFLAISLLAKA